MVEASQSSPFSRKRKQPRVTSKCCRSSSSTGSHHVCVAHLESDPMHRSTAEMTGRSGTEPRNANRPREPFQVGTAGETELPEPMELQITKETQAPIPCPPSRSTPPHPPPPSHPSTPHLPLHLSTSFGEGGGGGGVGHCTKSVNRTASLVTRTDTQPVPTGCAELKRH